SSRLLPYTTLCRSPLHSTAGSRRRIRNPNNLLLNRPNNVVIRAERGTSIHVKNALQFRQALSRDEVTITAIVGVPLIEELMHEHTLRHIPRVSPPFEIELGILVDLIRNIRSEERRRGIKTAEART